MNAISVRAVCQLHLHDPVLKDQIARLIDNEDEICSYCGASGAVAFDFLQEEVDQVVHRFFKPAQESPYPWDEVEDGSAGPIYDISEVLKDELPIADALDDEVYDDVLASFVDPQWIRFHKYELRQRDQDQLWWAEFCHIVQYERRFSSPTGPCLAIVGEGIRPSQGMYCTALVT